MIGMLYSCAMFSMLVSGVVHHGFKPRSAQTKDHKIGICCFSTKHAALKSKKAKTRLARNQDNVSKRSDMSTRRVLFQ